VSEPVLLARIRRARGIRGEVVIESLGSAPDRFQPGLCVYLAGPGEPGLGREAEIEHAWLHNGEIVVRFKGVDTRNAAEELRGLELRIPESERPTLAEGEFYLSDLVGCTMFRTDGSEVGEVVAWHDYGAAPLLEVKQGKGELLVPFTPVFYREVDVANRRIVTELPEGLEDVNAR
jgi:16S rRNA processing protein RimM